MKALITGRRNGIDWPAPGEELEVSASEGRDLCANGYAEPIADLRVETATARPTEKRTRRAAN